MVLPRRDHVVFLSWYMVSLPGHLASAFFSRGTSGARVCTSSSAEQYAMADFNGIDLRSRTPRQRIKLSPCFPFRPPHLSNTCMPNTRHSPVVSELQARVTSVLSASSADRIARKLSQVRSRESLSRQSRADVTDRTYRLGLADWIAKAALA